MKITKPATQQSGKHPLRRVIAGTVTAVLTSGALIAAGTSAGATSLAEWSTFNCYKGIAAQISGGNLVVNDLSVNDDGRTTSWFPAVYQWNSTSRTWVIDAVGSPETFVDSGLGSLTEHPFRFNVAANHYYSVVLYMRSTGDTITQVETAQAMTGGAPIGSGICAT